MIKHQVLYFLAGLLLLSGCGGLLNEGENNYRAVKEGGLYGYVDQSGKKVIGNQFNYAIDFSEGLGAVNVGGTSNGINMPEDGKWGFINPDGSFLINPKYYSPPDVGEPYQPRSYAQVLHEGYQFSEGLAAVRTETEWVYIDTTDQVVIRNKRIKSARRFSEGLAAVFINGKWGYIDKRGTIVIEPQFNFPVNFRDGFVVLLNEKYQKVCYNRKGERVFSQYRLESNFHEGVAAVKAKFKGENISFTDELKYGLVDTAGRMLFEPQFDQVGRFGSGLCPVLMGSRPGSLAANGKIPVMEPYSGGKWGFVNTNGQIVFNPVYDEAKGFCEGLAAVRKGPYWAIMNPSGRLISQYEFRWVGYFENGIAEVLLGPAHNDYDFKYAFVNNRGDVVWIEP